MSSSSPDKHRQQRSVTLPREQPSPKSPAPNPGFKQLGQCNDRRGHSTDPGTVAACQPAAVLQFPLSQSRAVRAVGSHRTASV